MNPYRGEAPFPQAGEGAFVHFSVSDLVELENEFGEDFAEAILLGLERASPKVTAKCLDVGLKVREGDQVKRLELGMDDYPFHLNAAQMPILDAITLARLGMPYGDALAEAIKLEEEQRKADDGSESEFIAENPIKGSDTSSEQSASDSEPDSTQEKSGD